MLLTEIIEVRKVSVDNLTLFTESYFKLADSIKITGVFEPVYIDFNNNRLYDENHQDTHDFIKSVLDKGKVDVFCLMYYFWTVNALPRKDFLIV